MFKKADVFLICVPTPLSKSNDPDLSYIKATLNSAKKFLHKSLFICLESTTYPGTTKELMNPIAEQLNFKIGKDIFVGYSPEREDPVKCRLFYRDYQKSCFRYNKRLSRYMFIILCNIYPQSLSCELNKRCRINKTN